MTDWQVYLNLGNSRVHWGLYDGQTWVAEGHALRGDPHATLRQVSQVAISLKHSSAGPVHVVGVTSSGAVETWDEAVLSDWGRPLELLGRDFEGRVVTRYTNPQQWGQDRLANVLAVISEGLVPAAVLDAGTCLTADVVSAEREHLGGAIAPGLSASRAGMVAQAPHLDRFMPSLPLHSWPDEAGLSAEGNLQLGLALALAGTARGMIEHLREATPGTPHVVLTGGDGPLLSRMLRGKTHARPRLTLDGLRLAYESAGAARA